MIAACAMQCLNAHRVRIICMQCPYAMPLMPYGRPAGLLQKRIQAKISGDRSGQRFITGRNKHALPSVCAGLLALSSLASCSDWTRPESVEIHAPTLEEQDPELYAQYLQNLREYKESEHKIVILKYDNVPGIPSGQADRLSAIPDSVDYVILTAPDNLSETVISEMEKIRTEKGTKVLYRISYDDIKAGYDAYMEHWNEEHPDSTGDNAGESTDDSIGDGQQPVEFIEYLSDRTGSLLSLADEFKYDGIEIAYTGIFPESLQENDKKELAVLQDTFFNLISEWMDGHPQAQCLFSGMPVNLLDRTAFLERCRYIITDATDAVNAYELSFKAIMAMSADSPADRLVINVSIPGKDSEDTGYFISASGDEILAVAGAAEWVMVPEQAYKKCGLCIDNAKTDYYNPVMTYGNIRKAISNMNPSPLN